MPCRRHPARLAALAAFLLVPSFAVATLTYETKYLSGQAAPGGQFTFPTFSGIGNGSINADGEIAFIADVNRLEHIGQPFVTRSEILSEGAGSIGNPAQVVRIGDSVTNAPTGVTYLGLGSPTITDAGNVGFTGGRSDMPRFDDPLGEPFLGRSLFMTSVSDPGQARVVLTSADEPVAELGGESISSITGFRFGSAGGFTATLGFDVAFVPGTPGRDETVNAVVVSGNANGIDRVVAAPFIDTLPTLPPADVLVDPGPGDSHTSNPKGEIMFLQVVLRDGQFFQPEVALFSEAAGSLGNPVEIIRTNDPITQFGQDLLVSNIDRRLSVNDAGQHAYIVEYGPAGTAGPAQGRAFFSESLGTPGNPGVVHRSGDIIPGGISTSFNFLTGLPPSMGIGAGGHVLIAGVTNRVVIDDEVVQPNYHGVWLHGPEANSELELVYQLRRNQSEALELDGQLPEFGVFEGSPVYEHAVTDFELNARGQVAFHVSLINNTEPSSPPQVINGGTIYATDLEGDVQIIARTGQLFDVNDDPLLEDLRTLDQVTLNGFTDHGELLFNATFADGSSGLFTAGVDAIDRIPGDFNFDGMVDAADYTTWRDGLGTRFDQADYTTWVNNFGATGSSPASAVPEPSACLLLLLVAYGGARSRSR